MLVLDVSMRTPRVHVTFMLSALLGLSACGKSAEDEAPKVFDYTNAVSADGDSKALMYNLIGRFFPTEEIKRLDDDSMTPQAWCNRDPSMIRVLLDEVEVQCNEGEQMSAAIARVTRHESGGIQIVLRASEEAPLKSLLFEKVIGSNAQITGSPCFAGKPTAHARFPKIETLRRQILGGQRCAQIRDRPSLDLP